MNVTFLQAAVPLTKTYTDVDGEIEKTPYPMTWEFTSHDVDVETLTDLHKAMVKHAKSGHCMLKGKLSRPLIKESRAGATNANDSTSWLVLDLDGLPEHLITTTPSKQSFSTPLTLDLFLSELGLADVSYIAQYSASYKISDNKIRAHVIMLLDKPYAAPLLKQWLIQKNHEVELLRSAMELTKTGNAVRWPLDISACQNDKLIYIAPPMLKGIKDPMGKQPRIELVSRKYDMLAISSQINTAERNKSLTHARINELRQLSDLPARKFNYKILGGAEVLLKPDEAIVTEIKIERDFVYFNLNGGDSWAYYHPEDKPDYIYNFKGEPTYLTKELLPTYWQELTSRGVTRTSSQGVMYLAFCDRKTGTYWRGTYDNMADILDIYQAKNETQIRHFCAQHGIPIGDFVPEWDVVFDPHDNIRVDVANRVVNRFKPSQYMKGVVKDVKQCPPTIFYVLHHALGQDVEITEHFINWLAYVLQYRDRTKTAWVLHGTQGTGKGVFTNNVLRPIFGAHTATRRMEELNEKYNHFMADSLLVFVDEVQIKALGNERGIMAKLKNFITEEQVPIRAMYSNSLESRNYTNWIFMSNMSDPVMIDKGDRRFNVGKYQSAKLVISDAEIKLIDKELQQFHDYLMMYPVDQERVRQIINSEDRNNMIAISESSLDNVSSALLNGTFEYFIDMLPTDAGYQRNALVASKVEDYKQTLKLLMLRTRDDGVCNIAREELRTLYDYLTDNIPKTPNKFTSLLKHHRVHITKVSVEGKTVNGIQVVWSDCSEFERFTKEHFTVSIPKLKL